MIGSWSSLVSDAATAPLPGDNMRREAFGREPSAVERALDYISRSIRRGRFAPGTRMPSERQLAELAGVSRASVRAALRTLSASGVVRIKHGAGTFVTTGPASFDARSVELLSTVQSLTPRQILQTRRSLELTAAELAATHASADQLVALSDAITGMFESTNDVAAFVGHDSRFHAVLAEASGNPLIAAVLGMVTGAYFRRRRVSPRTAEQLHALAARHREVFLAVRARNASRAREAMRRHLEDQPEPPVDQ